MLESISINIKLAIYQGLREIDRIKNEGFITWLLHYQQSDKDKYIEMGALLPAKDEKEYDFCDDISDR